MNDIAKRLQKPFTENDYEWRIQQESYDGTKVSVLCYVTARAIQNRLDDIFGPFGWKPSYKPGANGGVVCALSIYNKDSKEWVTKEDGADNTNIEGVKGGMSGAIKRAAVVWGIGRLLYNLDAVKVPLTPKGEHYHKVKNGKNKDTWMYWNPPKLPEWAIAGSKEDKEPSKEPPKAEPPATKDTKLTRASAFWKLFGSMLIPGHKPDPWPGNGNVIDEILITAGSWFSANTDGNYEHPTATMTDDCTGYLALAAYIAGWEKNPEKLIGIIAAAQGRKEKVA